MSLLSAWVVFPLVLLALALGCGLALEAACRRRIPGPLLLPVGLGTIIVLAQFPTLADRTAELAAPLVVAVAIIGFGLTRPWRERRPDPWIALAALGVFAAFAAPVVLSGEATFAGYIKLDDTATWMALTDRVMEHGRSLEGLAASSYEETLAFNLADGYPIGVFLPLGIGAALSGSDVAWLVQPYLALLAAALACALAMIVRPLVASGRRLGLVVFLAAQPALLYGYAMWGGIKELAAAGLIALVAGLAPGAVKEAEDPRALVPLAVAAAALIGVLSAGGALWLAALLLAALAALVRLHGPAVAVRGSVSFLVASVVLCLPVVGSGSLLPPTSSPLTAGDAQGNLLAPLHTAQLLGIWPASDFRTDPVDGEATALLLVVLCAAALAGVLLAVRGRAWSLLLYVVGATLGALAIAAIGSPWVDGKALATGSPALLLAAGVAGAVMLGSGRRIEGAVLLIALCGGVLWSNALAYRGVNLAPRDQLVELEEIGPRIAGQGPTLMTEYQPYGVRHFLREADPEGVSELRHRLTPLRNGKPVQKGYSADTDELELEGLLVYRTLVLRRSPAQSRPPAPYELVSSDAFYDVWQRPTGRGAIIEHLPLGTEVDPGAIPSCARVMELARDAGPSAWLAAVPRRPVVVLPMSETRHPVSWEAGAPGSGLSPGAAGVARAEISIPEDGLYQAWLGGTVRSLISISVDGDAIGSRRHLLNNFGQYIPLGAATFAAGPHAVDLEYSGSDLHPGSGGLGDPIGPLVLSPSEAADTEVTYVRTANAERLCGKRWDWIEALAPRPG